MHPSAHEVTLVGASGTEYHWRADFETAYEIEAALGTGLGGAVSPLQISIALSTMSVSLMQGTILLRVGMECYRKHRKTSHQPITDAQSRNALGDIGVRRLCEAIAHPLNRVYQLVDEDSEESETEADPTSATPSGVA